MWTYPPKEILVPTDFGNAATRALEAASVLVERFGARLTVLHAESFEAPPYFTEEQIEVLERQHLQARAAAVAYTRGEAAKVVGTEFTARVVDGPPADAILDAARAADLVVMGTHGRRGPRRWWLGSVAERVAGHTSVPVIVVRSGIDARTPPARIVSVTEAGVYGGDSERYARGLADTFGADLVVMAMANLETDRLTNTTLVVMPVLQGRAAHWYAPSAERMLRTVEAPVLFVPAARDSR